MSMRSSLRPSNKDEIDQATQPEVGAEEAATTLVVVIGWLYLIPQMQGAGLTLRTVVGAPTWVGVLAVGLVVLLAVADLGGGEDCEAGIRIRTSPHGVLPIEDDGEAACPYCGTRYTLKDA